MEHGIRAAFQLREEAMREPAREAADLMRTVLRLNGVSDVRVAEIERRIARDARLSWSIAMRSVQPDVAAASRAAHLKALARDTEEHVRLSLATTTYALDSVEQRAGSGDGYVPVDPLDVIAQQFSDALAEQSCVGVDAAVRRAAAASASDARAQALLVELEHYELGATARAAAREEALYVGATVSHGSSADIKTAPPGKLRRAATRRARTPGPVPLQPRAVAPAAAALQAVEAPLLIGETREERTLARAARAAEREAERLEEQQLLKAERLEKQRHQDAYLQELRKSVLSQGTSTDSGWLLIAQARGILRAVVAMVSTQDAPSKTGSLSGGSGGGRTSPRVSSSEESGEPPQTLLERVAHKQLERFDQAGLHGKTGLEHSRARTALLYLAGAAVAAGTGVALYRLGIYAREPLRALEKTVADARAFNDSVLGSGLSQEEHAKRLWSRRSDKELSASEISRALVDKSLGQREAFRTSTLGVRYINDIVYDPQHTEIALVQKIHTSRLLAAGLAAPGLNEQADAILREPGRFSEAEVVSAHKSVWMAAVGHMCTDTSWFGVRTERFTHAPGLMDTGKCTSDMLRIDRGSQELYSQIVRDAEYVHSREAQTRKDVSAALNSYADRVEESLEALAYTQDREPVTRAIENVFERWLTRFGAGATVNRLARGTLFTGARAAEGVAGAVTRDAPALVGMSWVARFTTVGAGAILIYQAVTANKITALLLRSGIGLVTTVLRQLKVVIEHVQTASGEPAASDGGRSFATDALGASGNIMGVLSWASSASMQALVWWQDIMTVLDLLQYSWRFITSSLLAASTSITGTVGVAGVSLAAVAVMHHVRMRTGRDIGDQVGAMLSSGWRHRSHLRVALVFGSILASVGTVATAAWGPDLTVDAGNISYLRTISDRFAVNVVDRPERLSAIVQAQLTKATGGTLGWVLSVAHSAPAAAAAATEASAMRLGREIRFEAAVDARLRDDGGVACAPEVRIRLARRKLLRLRV